MDFQDIIEIIRNPNLRAKIVFDAIHDGLEYLITRLDSVDQSVNELRGMYSYLNDSEIIDNSSIEVVGARGGHSNLNDRIISMEEELEELYQLFDAIKPVIITETKVERLPFGRTTENNSDLLPSQSYIRVPGVEGSVTIQTQNEYINGKFNKEISRTVISRVEPVDEIYVQGTKASIANRPIRYIRFVARLLGKQEGRWIEVEIFAGNTKLTNPNTVTMIQSGKFAENGLSPLYDGAKQYWATIINAPNPYIQVDLGSARHDITKASMTLHPGSSYELINIEVSSDNKTFYRVHTTSVNNATLGQEISIDMNTLYRTDPISAFQDTTAVLPGASDVPIGGIINVKKGVTRIYPNAGVAAIKSGGLTYGGTATSLVVTRKAYVTNKRPTSGSFETINSTTWYIVSSTNSVAKPAGTYLTIYSDGSAGWFREDDL